MRTTVSCLVLAAVLCSARTAPAATPEAATGLRIEPAEVVLGMFHGGTTVRVTGRVPAGSEAAVVCVGPRADLAVKTKEKVFGVVWMNTGDAALHDVPAVYLMKASASLDSLAAGASLAGLGVGYQALASEAGTPSDDARGRWLFGQLVKLKEKEGLYSAEEGGVAVVPEGDGRSRVRCDLRLPARAPAGNYRVDLIGFRSGSGRCLGSSELQIRHAGVSAAIFSLAQRHGFLYGVLAVSVALVVGLLTGFVFGLGGKHGH